jgi:hypothetical protein
METSARELLTDWLFRIRTAQVAHIKSIGHFERLNLWLGIPVVLLTTLVGTSVFATLQQDASVSIKIAAGVASVLAAILSGLQTFLRYAEQAERHRGCGPKYGALRKEIEQKLALPPRNEEQMEQYVDSVRIRWEKLSEDSPPVPQWIWDRVEAEIAAVKTAARA